MSKIIEHDTHTEIVNGLFIDKKDSIAKDNLKETLDFKVRRAGINNLSNMEITLFTSGEGRKQFNRAMQEQMYTQLTNMSEEQLIQYFDRISQQEEN